MHVYTVLVWWTRGLSLFSLFSVIFGLTGLINTLVWPRFSETAVIFIDHVFINPAIYIYIYALYIHTQYMYIYVRNICIYVFLVSSVDRAPVCRAGGLGFEPPAGPTLRVLK